MFQTTMHNIFEIPTYKILDNKWRAYYYFGTNNRYSLWLKKIFFSMITLMLLSNGGCNKIPDFDIKKLTYRGKFVFNNQLRIDGIYYMSKKDAIIYLFQDGTCFLGWLVPGKYNPSSGCYQIEPQEREPPDYWGCYVIDDNILKIQTFDVKPMGGMYSVEERWATIEDEETLHFFLSKRDRPTGPKEVVLDYTFHFKHCSDKPDSTNILMKYY